MTRISQWSLARIAAAVDGRLEGGDAHVVSVSTDTRTIGPGSLFVPLVGERFDGHDFAKTAAEQGAAALLASKPIDVSIPVIFVDDTLKALQALSHALWEEADEEGLLTIALTGSNGKTTTKELMACLWRATLGDDLVHATRGNLNNHIGVPLTLCALSHETRVAIIEMGANQFGDIDELIRLAPGRLRVVTSIGESHLEKLGDLAGVRRVKGEIFRACVEDETVAIVPLAERGALIPDDWSGAVWAVGEGGRVDVSTQADRGQQRVTVHTELFEFTLTLGLPGRHNAENLGTAIATLAAAGVMVDATRLQDALDALELPDGRLRSVEHGRFRVIDDAYNANPTSTRASYDAFLEIEWDDRRVEATDRVAVVGEMLELGESSSRLHVEVARDLAKRGGSSLYIFVGPDAAKMAKEAIDAGSKAVACDDVEVAASVLNARKHPTLVWLKGSRGARLERIFEYLDR